MSHLATPFNDVSRPLWLLGRHGGLLRLLLVMIIGIASSGAVAAADAPPSIAVPASATPTSVTGKTSTLRVTATDDPNTAALIYTWTGAAGVTFSASNGTTTGKTCTATFPAIGDYTCVVTVQDAIGQTATSTVGVTVVSTLTSLALTPSTTVVNVGASQAFAVLAKNQYGLALDPQPMITWAATGAGSIDGNGIFTAGPVSGNATITATAGAKTVSRVLRVNAGPTIAAQVATTTPVVDGTTAVFTAAGADDQSIDELLYTWSATSSTGKTVSFAPRRSILGEETTATFRGIGTYSIFVVVSDKQGLSATSSTVVDVVPMATSLTIAPSTNVVVNPGLTKPFVATVRDQFTAIMVPQPTIGWAVTTGSGSIGSDGIYLAGDSGPATVTATSSAASGSVTLRVNAAPTVASPVATTTPIISGTTAAFTVQGADDDNVDSLSYIWTASGPKGVVFLPKSGTTAEATTATFAAAGTYTITAKITDKQALATTGSVVVTVVQTPTGLGLSPATAVVNPTKARVFAVQGRDQFNLAISGAEIPATTWRATGGTIDAVGRFVAGPTPGFFAVTAEVATEPPTTLPAVVRVNAAPTVVGAPTTTGPNPTTDLTIPLTVQGSDDGGETSLRYRWSATGPLASGVVFGGVTQNTNAAKSIVATVPGPGMYSFTVLIWDTQGLAASATIPVQVTDPEGDGSVLPSPPTVTLEIVAGLSGDSQEIINGEAISFSKNDQLTCRVMATPGAVGDVISSVSIDAGNGTSIVGVAGSDLVVLVSEGRMELRASGTAMRNGQSAIGQTVEPIIVLVDKTPPQIRWKIKPVGSESEVDLRHSATDEADIIYLNGNDDSDNATLRTNRGWNVYAVDGFSPVAEIDDDSGLSSTATVLGWVKNATGQDPLQLNPATTIGAQPSRLTCSGFASLTDSIVFESSTLQPASVAGAYSVVLQLTDKAGNTTEATQFRVWVDRVPPIALPGILPLQRQGAPKPFEIAPGGATEITPAWWVVSTWDACEGWQGASPIQRQLIGQDTLPTSGTTSLPLSGWRLSGGVNVPGSTQILFRDIAGNKTTQHGGVPQNISFTLKLLSVPNVQMQTVVVPYGDTIQSPEHRMHTIDISKLLLPDYGYGIDRSNGVCAAEGPGGEPSGLTYLWHWPARVPAALLENKSGLSVYPYPITVPGAFSLVGELPVGMRKNVPLPTLTSEELQDGAARIEIGSNTVVYSGGLGKQISYVPPRNIVVDALYVGDHGTIGYDGDGKPFAQPPLQVVGDSLSQKPAMILGVVPGDSPDMVNDFRVSNDQSVTVHPCILNIPASWAQMSVPTTIQIKDPAIEKARVVQDIDLVYPWWIDREVATFQVATTGYPDLTVLELIWYGWDYGEQYMRFQAWPTDRIHDEGRQATMVAGVQPDPAAPGAVVGESLSGVSWSSEDLKALTGTLSVDRQGARPGFFRIGYETTASRLRKKAQRVALTSPL